MKILDVQICFDEDGLPKKTLLYSKQGRKRPLDTPERKIERMREREKGRGIEREREWKGEDFSFDSS